METSSYGVQRSPASVGFVSLFFWLYYRMRLKPIRNDTGALKLLIHSFLRGPRVFPVTEAKHVAGYCYEIDLDEDYLCDQLGYSVLILLEGDDLLRGPHAASVQEIIEQGGGRYLHVRRKLYFSPSDNLDLATHPKNYRITESVSHDPKILVELLKWNQRRSTRNDLILDVIERLKIFTQGRLKIGAVVNENPSTKKLSEVSLQLSDLGLGLWRSRSLTLAYGDDGSAMELSAALDIHIPGLIDSGEVSLFLKSRVNGEMLEACFSLRENNLLCCEILKAGTGECLQVGIVVSCLQSIRERLIHECDGVINYSNWLRGFIAALDDGRLNFGVALGPSFTKHLFSKLNPAGNEEAATLFLGAPPGEKCLTLDLVGEG